VERHGSTIFARGAGLLRAKALRALPGSSASTGVGVGFRGGLRHTPRGSTSNGRRRRAVPGLPIAALGLILSEHGAAPVETGRMTVDVAERRTAERAVHIDRLRPDMGVVSRIRGERDEIPPDSPLRNEHAESRHTVSSARPGRRLRFPPYGRGKIPDGLGPERRPGASAKDPRRGRHGDRVRRRWRGARRDERPQ